MEGQPRALPVNLSCVVPPCDTGLRFALESLVPRVKLSEIQLTQAGFDAVYSSSTVFL